MFLKMKSRSNKVNYISRGKANNRIKLSFEKGYIHCSVNTIETIIINDICTTVYTAVSEKQRNEKHQR